MGSGISRAAGIPTGWEVTLDLVGRIAQAEGEEITGEPAKWYASKYKKEPSYSDLLKDLCATPDERRALLSTYFEPSAEDREKSLKVPTKAHKAIAELVKSGHVRVVITTNFDRLIETALRNAGVEPVVISTDDAIKGSAPLAHLRNAVVKVHGDYLDRRIKNTEDELAIYSKKTNSFLGGIFDSFGLLVCGWSAEWDSALRGCIEGCTSRRYSTFWVIRSNLGAAAQKLVSLRDAITIRSTADQLFEGVVHRLRAIESYGQSHPISARVAVAEVKACLVDEKLDMRLSALVLSEAEKIRGAIDAEKNMQMRVWTPEVVLEVLETYEALSESLLSLFPVLCQWAGERHLKLLSQTVFRLSELKNTDGTVARIEMRRYPALCLMYLTVLAGIFRDRFDVIKHLLLGIKILDRYRNEKSPLVVNVHPYTVFCDGADRYLGKGERNSPVSRFLEDRLSRFVSDIYPDPEEYKRMFDRSEYLMSLLGADVTFDEANTSYYPVGSYQWRNPRISSEMDAEIEESGQSWPPLQAGLFNGSLERLRAVKDSVDQQIARRPYFG